MLDVLSTLVEGAVYLDYLTHHWASQEWMHVVSSNGRSRAVILNLWVAAPFVSNDLTLSQVS